LVVALFGTLAAGAIGTWLGIVAGYMGKWWDQVIMRITDAWLTLPSLVFAILLSSVRGPGLWNVVFILVMVFWSRYARAVRGEVLTLRERDFVKAGRDQWRQ
jgi:peptide/nickel transport system permease protein